MAGMYNTASSTSPAEPDDFTLLLHEILLRSTSSTSSSVVVGPMLHPTSNPPVQPGRVGPGSDPGAGEYYPVNYVLGSSVDNDLDEYDCESEEGIEANLVEEMPAKTAPSRNPSKRTRAAEVHNLSEKRRRSRINEKLKALQNLIPNSNKTDKASMLDEAIEYLKQLQLQVQMLTMRNGLNLYPNHMCLPGVSSHSAQLSQMNMGLLEGNGPLNIEMTTIPPVDQDPNSTNVLNQVQSSRVNMSNVINSGTSFGLVSSFQGPLHLSPMVRGIYREDMLPHQQQDVVHCRTNLRAQSSSHRQDNALGMYDLGSQEPQLEHPILPLLSKSTSTGRTPSGDIKDDRLNF